MALRSRLACVVAALAVVLCCLSGLTCAQSVMDHEPVEHLKAHLPKSGDKLSGHLEAFLQLPQPEMSRKTAQMGKNLKKVLKGEAHVSAFLIKGADVLAQRAASGVKFNSTFLLPYGNLLSVLSTTLPILLENYKRELLHKKMGDVLKGKHRENSDVKDYLSLSLHDLVTKLPQKEGGDSVDLKDPGLLSELNRRGKAAVYYVNTVLEDVAEDAWKDALISVAMDQSAFSSNGQMITHFMDLGMYAEALSNDLVNFFEVSKSDLYPLDGGHFLFGWWINCPRGSSGSKESRCLAPFLPSDSVAVLNPAIRIYSIPRLTLHLIVGNTGNTASTHTMTDVLQQDKLIWKAIYSVVAPPTAEDATAKQQQQKPEKKAAEDAETQTQDGKKEQQETAETVEEATTEQPQKREEKLEKAAEDTETRSREEKEKQQEIVEEVATEQPQKREEPEAPTQKMTTPDKPVQEDEVIGESMLKSAASKDGKTPGHKPEAKHKEDVVREKKNQEETGGGEGRSWLVQAIYTSWPISVLIFYTVLSHVWVYWIAHVTWFICSSLFPGVHLPRPKSAKQE